MLDQNFCDYLEYELSQAFSYSTDHIVKKFWCDGILLPSSENDISKKNINDKREVLTTGFVGFDGQERYNVILKFGNKALSRYARDLDIKECIPDTTTSDWYYVDTTQKTLTIRLL